MKNFQLGIIGNPITHSLSPLMHKAALQALHLKGDYEAKQILPENFEQDIILCKTQWCGWNVTVPYKGKIIEFLDHVDPFAKQINSVNTVVRLADHSFCGFSTDGYGLLKAIQENLHFSPDGHHVILIGAGGASRAAAGILAQNNIANLTIINRSYENAVNLKAFVKEIAPKCSINILLTQNIKQPLSQGDLVIQGTSLGLNKEDPLPFNPLFLPKKCVVFDMIYDTTPFLQKVKEIGIAACDGLDMLLYQGVKSFEYWTEHDAPVEIMRQTLYQAKGR